MFVGFLQQPGGGPCYFGHWDPEELSSLHSSPSPIHRHPFSAHTSPTDPTEPLHNGDTEPDHFEHKESDKSRELDCSTLKPLQSLELNQDQSNEQLQTLQISLKESLESTNQPHSKPSVDTVQWCPNQAEAQENQVSPSPPEAAGIIRLGHIPDLRESTENLSNQRDRQSSSSESWPSSPELDRDHERKSTCTDRHSRVTTHNNNNIRVKSSEKDKNATSPPAQGSK